jgi:hypothetical protein
MTTFLNGFSISHFRSFGEETQFIHPLKKINIVIGENNSGKSNVTRYVSKVLGRYLNGAVDLVVPANEAPQNGISQPLKRQFVLAQITHDTSKNLVQNPGHIAQFNEDIATFCSLCKQKGTEGQIWIPLELQNSAGRVEDYFDAERLESDAEAAATIHRLGHYIGIGPGILRSHTIPEIYKALLTATSQHCAVKTIAANRRIESCLPEFEAEFGKQTGSAKELIEKLAQLDRPSYQSRDTSSKRWDMIHGFVRKILKDDTIQLQIPAEKNTINFECNGRFLPIETLGTGVYQAILFAAETVYLENTVVCIEEPELHLHPELQRQLMSFLIENTNNQYFITTHSAHLMDSVDCAVISVRLENNKSLIEMPMKAQDRRDICQRLGYRPSDLLQSNCLIWIEGPSDRIYIRHWLSAVDVELKEGWHFSFALYGGRVLSHYSASDEEVDEDKIEEFIQLLPVNRYPFFVMDSDLKAEGEVLNATKLRIIAELEKNGIESWVTQGREIENYVRHDLREAAVKAVHPSVEILSVKSAEENRYSDPLSFSLKKGKTLKQPDKPRIAEQVTKINPDLDVLDLRAQISSLARFIRLANRMPEKSH